MAFITRNTQKGYIDYIPIIGNVLLVFSHWHMLCHVHILFLLYFLLTFFFFTYPAQIQQLREQREQLEDNICSLTGMRANKPSLKRGKGGEGNFS